MEFNEGETSLLSKMTIRKPIEKPATFYVVNEDQFFSGKYMRILFY